MNASGIVRTSHHSSGTYRHYMYRNIFLPGNTGCALTEICLNRGCCATHGLPRCGRGRGKKIRRAGRVPLARQRDQLSQRPIPGEPPSCMQCTPCLHKVKPSPLTPLLGCVSAACKIHVPSLQIYSWQCNVGSNMPACMRLDICMPHFGITRKIRWQRYLHAVHVHLRAL